MIAMFIFLFTVMVTYSLVWKDIPGSAECHAYLSTWEVLDVYQKKTGVWYIHSFNPVDRRLKEYVDALSRNDQRK